MGLADAIAAVMVVALVLYALTGGADFGGGVWDLLATGPRRDRQRRLVEQAIAPIWEANHVWLIVVVVILFTAFPPAFAAISIALHIPLTLLLLGIVARGSAFVFRHYGGGDPREQLRWGRVFAVASTISPIFLGIAIGAVTSGELRLEDGVPVGGYLSSWLGWFPFVVGLFALAQFAYLAAAYLTVEAADDPALQEDFRRRALAAGVLTGGLAWTATLLGATTPAALHESLLGAWWSLPLQGLTAAVALAALATLWTRRFRAARILVALQVTLVLVGWALAHYPYVVAPELTIAEAAAPRSTLVALGVALVAGLAVILPCLYWLYRVFKGREDAVGGGPVR